MKQNPDLLRVELVEKRARYLTASELQFLARLKSRLRRLGGPVSKKEADQIGKIIARGVS